MENNISNTGVPIVTSKTRGESYNIETILSRLRNERLIIPDYQRDSEQWNLRKESLFIESILNNLTIPAFFFSDREDGKIEIVDGQQRISTIQKFANNEFAISDDDDIVYLSPQSALYVGKRYEELPPQLKNVFDDYPLTVINLPEGLDLATKLEIFRRINEGGTPLTAQDIRLSYYSESKSVNFIRLAGIYSESSSSRRMIDSASNRGVVNPWDAHQETYKIWKDWWEGKILAKGQTPSEMFLWYLTLINRNNLNSLLSKQDTMKHLPVGFRGTTEEALDIYCAQLHYTDTDVNGSTYILPTYENGMREEFNSFAIWIRSILARSMAGVSVDKYKQTALLIGACVELNLTINDINNDAWDAITEFIKTPRKAGGKWLDGGYPEQKGRWVGIKGQKAQCDAAVQILKNILEETK